MRQYIRVFHVNEQAKLIAYHRWMEDGQGDDVIVVANHLILIQLIFHIPEHGNFDLIRIGNGIVKILQIKDIQLQHKKANTMVFHIEAILV
jgi:hypothetical protein